MTEAKALNIGIEWCIQNDISKLEIESDSKLLIEWILHSKDPPWNLWDIIRKIKGHLILL